MAKVKGSAIKATLGYLEKHAGRSGVRDILARMEPKEREVLQGAILVSNWYDFRLLARLMETAEGAVPVPPGSTTAIEMGRFSADYGLKTLYRVFIKLADPAFVIGKTAQIYATYYDSGNVTLLDLGPREVSCRLVGFEEPNRSFCERILGFMERSIELSGAENVVSTHARCSAHGDESCEFKFTWE
jgi:hypothetical protein